MSCLQRPEEGDRFSEARLLVVVSYPLWVLGIEHGSLEDEQLLPDFLTCMPVNLAYSSNSYLYDNFLINIFIHKI